MAEAQPIRIAGVAGSLRQHSYNRGLLRAAQEVAPDWITVDVLEIADIPLYNYDVEVSAFPEAVTHFKERIRAADGLLIVSPEYNYSIPGVLKNAIDWASRPPNDTPLRQKPVAIAGVSTSERGTVRGQLIWRQVFASRDAYVMPKPELMVPRAAALFDEQGRLRDEATRNQIRQFLIAFADWCRRLR